MKKKYESCFLIEFPRIGNLEEGYLSVAQNNNLIPFEVKRVFWTYFTPEDIIRGRHAHHESELILIAVAGKIEVTVETCNGIKTHFILDKPNQGLYIPPNYWHTMKYSHNSVQLVLASTNYNEQDYIRDYNLFKEIWK